MKPCNRIVVPLPKGIARIAPFCCGCGNPEIFWGVILDVLEEYTRECQGRHDAIYQNPAWYFAANFLDSDTIELIEHGSNIAGAWLTEDGDEALAFLRTWGADWKSKAVFVDSDGVHHGDL